MHYEVESMPLAWNGLRMTGLVIVVWTAIVHSRAGDAQQLSVETQIITVPRGVPLHIRVIHTAHLRKGAAVEGVLTEPVYVYDRLVLPRDTPIRGSVSRLVPAERKTRIHALLNGDVTPLHDPVVDFDSIHIGGEDIPLNSEALMRSEQMVSFTSGKQRPSLMQQAKTAIKERIRSTREAFLAPGKKDRALKLLFSQLPYHPQRIWAGSQFIADLNAPAEVTLPAETPLVIAPASESSLDNIVVTARLVSPLSSDLAKKGDVVTASVIKPVLNREHQLVLAEGTQLEGTVLQAQPSRSFSRNGQLRFVFRSVQPTHQEKEEVHGTLTAAEGNSAQNLTVDQEGGVKSNPDKNRFVAPLLLGALAVAGHSRDRDGDNNGLGRDTVASNGFGIVARILALTVNDRNVATGFAIYATAKSVYFRFLTRGHPITFPKDTLIQVQLSTRR
jgi:hypothetical protein